MKLKIIRRTLADGSVKEYRYERASYRDRLTWRDPGEEEATRTAIALEQRRPRRVRGVPAIIYFMRVPSGHMKIGHTSDLERRWRSVQSCHHEKVSVIAAFFADTAIEQEIHWELRDLRVRGEWHREDPRIAAIIIRLSTSKPRADRRSQARFARVLRVNSGPENARLENAAKTG